MCLLKWQNVKIAPERVSLQSSKKNIKIFRYSITIFLCFLCCSLFILASFLIVDRAAMRMTDNFELCDKFEETKRNGCRSEWIFSFRDFRVGIHRAWRWVKFFWSFWVWIGKWISVDKHSSNNFRFVNLNKMENYYLFFQRIFHFWNGSVTQPIILQIVSSQMKNVQMFIEMQIC